MNINLNMDLFVSKLRKTVSEVAYQVNTSVNTIIPGNPIHRDYETLKLRCSHGCPGFVWTVHDAVKRDSASLKASLKDAIGPNFIPMSSSSSANIQQVPNEENGTSDNKQLYSVFVFDKSQLDCLSSKNDKEMAIDHLKKSVVQLTRLRHPSILTVHHPLEESRSSLAFVTEHVYGHLDSILKEQRGKRVNSKKSMKSSAVANDLVDLNQDLGPKDADYQSDTCQLDEVQIKAGLLQICDGIKFLHRDAKMLHKNLCLDNVFVDSNNTWKIAGFDFSCHESGSIAAKQAADKTNSSLQILEYTPTIANSPMFPSLKTLYPNLPSNIVPNWSCSAPEHSNSEYVSYSSDIFSLGIMSCALLSRDMDMIDLSYEYGLISDTYKRGIHFRELADRLPVNLKTSMMKYAAMNEDSRPSLDEYQDLAIFDDQHVKAIRDLDSHFGWDRLKKIDFFNRLRDILPKLSHQIKVNRVAKSLFNEVVNPDMVPYVLPSILIIAKDSTPTEFKLKIFPNLKGPFRILQPKSVPLMILDNLVVLADRAKLCMTEFQQSAFTLIQYLLKMQDQQLIDKCLIVLPNVKKFIDIASMNQILLPEINKLYHETTNLSVRIKCLECIGNMIDVMEESSIVKLVIPMVFDLPTHEAEIVMSSASIVKTIVNDSKIDLNKDLLAGKILPFLIPLSVEKDLNLQQFSTIMTLIKNIMDRVEREQRALLGRKSQASGKSSGPLVIDNFKGSSHFQTN